MQGRPRGALGVQRTEGNIRLVLRKGLRMPATFASRWRYQRGAETAGEETDMAVHVHGTLKCRARG